MYTIHTHCMYVCYCDLLIIYIKWCTPAVHLLWYVHTMSNKTTKGPSVASYTVTESLLKCCSSTHCRSYVVMGLCVSEPHFNITFCRPIASSCAPQYTESLNSVS